MRNLLLVGIALLGLGLVGYAAKAVAADEAGAVSGVLIDNACAGRFATKENPEEAATKHPKSCAAKEKCAASGYAVISGKKVIKLDDKGNELAKEYLAKSDTTTKVTVKGTEKDGVLAVTGIEQAK